MDLVANCLLRALLLSHANEEIIDGVFVVYSLH